MLKNVFPALTHVHFLLGPRPLLKTPDLPVRSVHFTHAPCSPPVFLQESRLSTLLPELHLLRDQLPDKLIQSLQSPSGNAHIKNSNVRNPVRRTERNR